MLPTATSIRPPALDRGRPRSSSANLWEDTDPNALSPNSRSPSLTSFGTSLSWQSNLAGFSFPYCPNCGHPSCGLLSQLCNILGHIRKLWVAGATSTTATQSWQQPQSRLLVQRCSSVQCKLWGWQGGVKYVEKPRGHCPCMRMQHGKSLRCQIRIAKIIPEHLNCDGPLAVVDDLPQGNKVNFTLSSSRLQTSLRVSLVTTGAFKSCLVIRICGKTS